MKEQLAPTNRIISGLFADREPAERGYEILSQFGYDSDEITVLMSEETRDKYYRTILPNAQVVGTTATEGPGLGGVIGAGAGAVLGAAVAAGVSLALPGVGLIIAGPLSAAIAGAAVGGLSGGLLGSLIGVGIPEDRAKSYEEKVKEGRILIYVNARSEEDREKIRNAWAAIGNDVVDH